MSITLSSAATVTASVSLNGVNSESDASVALQSIQITYPTQVRLTYAYGNVSNNVFTPSSVFPKVVLTVDLQTGAWVSSTGQSGQLSSAGLTSLQTTVTNLQNTGENFAVNQSIFLGTQTPWVAATEL